MRDQERIRRASPRRTALDVLSRRHPRRLERGGPGLREIIGQERALKAIQTGLDIKSLGYNIFITGMVGTGRTTTIKQLLERLEKDEKTPDDILYVNNFKYPDEPSPDHAARRARAGSSARPWTTSSRCSGRTSPSS